jgi:hypothetical protein
MPIVIKSSDNGNVDPKSKTIRLPEHLTPRPPRFEDLRKLSLLRKAAMAAIPLAVVAMGLPAQATTLTLSDGNAVAKFDTGNGTGMNSLTVNGTQQVISQWWDYHLGAGAGPAVTVDSANNGITQTFISEPGTGTNSPGISFNGTTNFFAVTYSSPTGGTNGVPFDFVVSYTLTGAAPNNAGILENVKIDNNSKTGQTLPIRMFEYNHFNLNNQAHDTVNIGGSPVNTATQTSVTTGATSIETVVTPPPNFYQAVLGSTITTEFASAGFTDLPDVTSTPSAGDASWAFEWNPTIAGGQSFQISKARNIALPEPTLATLSLGAMSLLAVRRPRRQAAT